MHAYNHTQHFGRPRWVDHLRPGVQVWPGQHGETLSLLKTKKKKNTPKNHRKISQVWWRAPVVPATREAEAGELLEPSRRRLRWAKIMPLHSSLGNNSETPSQKIKRKGQKISQTWWCASAIPAIWEADWGGSLGPWRQSLPLLGTLWTPRW